MRFTSLRLSWNWLYLTVVFLYCSPAILAKAFPEPDRNRRVQSLHSTAWRFLQNQPPAWINDFRPTLAPDEQERQPNPVNDYERLITDNQNCIVVYEVVAALYLLTLPDSVEEQANHFFDQFPDTGLNASSSIRLYLKILNNWNQALRALSNEFLVNRIADLPQADAEHWFYEKLLSQKLTLDEGIQQLESLAEQITDDKYDPSLTFFLCAFLMTRQPFARWVAADLYLLKREQNHPDLQEKLRFYRNLLLVWLGESGQTLTSAPANRSLLGMKLFASAETSYQRSFQKEVDELLEVMEQTREQRETLEEKASRLEQNLHQITSECKERNSQEEQRKKRCQTQLETHNKEVNACNTELKNTHYPAMAECKRRDEITSERNRITDQRNHATSAGLVQVMEWRHLCNGWGYPCPNGVGRICFPDVRHGCYQWSLLEQAWLNDQAQWEREGQQWAAEWQHWSALCKQRSQGLKTYKAQCQALVSTWEKQKSQCQQEQAQIREQLVQCRTKLDDWKTQQDTLEAEATSLEEDETTHRVKRAELRQRIADWQTELEQQQAAIQASDESPLFSALETLGRGDDPLTEGIERVTDNLVKISYQYFPEETEQVLNVLGLINNEIVAVVEFIDDSTGNQASAFWHELDEPTQARVLGGGKVLSMVVPVARAKELVKKVKSHIPPNYSPAGAKRTGAFNEAKRQSGIPVSQQPSRVLPNIDRRGKPQSGKIYEFDIPSDGGVKTIRIRDDSDGHYYGENNPQNRGAHFNDEEGNHYDYK